MIYYYEGRDSSGQMARVSYETLCDTPEYIKYKLLNQYGYKELNLYKIN